MLSGRALAYAVLGWSLLKVGVDRLFGKRTGMALFRDNYDGDRLPPLDAPERARLVDFSGCIACGLCDVGEGERIATSRGAYRGIMALALASSRSMPDFDAAARAVDHVPQGVLRAKEAICPVRLPLAELAGFVRTKAALEMGAASRLSMGRRELEEAPDR